MATSICGAYTSPQLVRVDIEEQVDASELEASNSTVDSEKSASFMDQNINRALMKAHLIVGNLWRN